MIYIANKKMKQNQTISEHLKELRKEFTWVLIPCILIFIVTLGFSKYIIKELISYYQLSNAIVTLTPFESINTMITLSTCITVILSLPFILYSLYRFCKPTLNKQVQKAIKYNILYCLVLALGGLLFGLFIFSKMVLTTLLKYQVANPMWGVGSVIAFIITTSIILALVMQIIIIIPTLSKLGILNIKYLKQNRLIIMLIVITLSAFITPPDVVSQLFMFIPFYGSMELGLFITKWVEVKKNDRTW